MLLEFDRNSLVECEEYMTIILFHYCYHVTDFETFPASRRLHFHMRQTCTKAVPVMPFLLSLEIACSISTY